MRWFQCAIMACAVLGLIAGNSEAQKKEMTNKEKIVGRWETTKATTVPKGAVLEFTKDGKLKITASVNGKEISLEGTYAIDGDKINTVGPKGEKESMKIKKLTETELAVEDEKGKVDEFKKLKKK